MSKNKMSFFYNIQWSAVNLVCYVLGQNKTGNFIKNVKTTFGTKAFVAVCSLTTTVLVARFLGPEGRGAYSVALALGTVGVYLFLLGLNASNIHFVAKKRHLISNYVSNNIFFGAIVGALVIFVIIVIHFLSPHTILIENRILLGLSLLWIPISLINILSQSLLIGMENIRAFNKIEFISPAIGLLGVGLFIFFGVMSVEGFFFFALLGQVFGVGLGLHYLKSFIKNPISSLSIILLKENLLYGLKVLYFPSIFMFMLVSVDLLMVKHCLGEREAGYYSIATAFANFLLLLPGVISTLLFAKLSNTHEDQEKWGHTAKVIKGTTVLMFFSLLLVILLAEPVILFIFGSAFQPSVPAFIWLIPAIFFNSIATVYLNYFVATGRWAISAYATAVAVLINIFLNLNMIPYFGILGASYAASISFGFLMFSFIVYKIFLK